jgi:hypothetical protein
MEPAELQEDPLKECERLTLRRDFPKPLEMLKEGKFLNIQAPMVRYSKCVPLQNTFFALRRLS